MQGDEGRGILACTDEKHLHSSVWIVKSKGLVSYSIVPLQVTLERTYDVRISWFGHLVSTLRVSRLIAMRTTLKVSGTT